MILPPRYLFSEFCVFNNYIHKILVYAKFLENASNALFFFRKGKV